MLPLAPTARETVFEDGPSRLLCFEGAMQREGEPVLLVPSLINRWYVLDLHPGASVVQALVGAGLRVFCLDWGRPNDEDRYLEWDDIVARLQRAIRRVLRLTGASRVGLLGYSMGATLSAITTALAPERVATLVNLAGPIDFSHMGTLSTLTDPRWFDAEAVAAAGNVHPAVVRAGLVATRPTDQLGKWVELVDAAAERPEALEEFWALQAWVNDNVAFPAQAYLRWVRDLCQRNDLWEGRHRVRGRRVDLGAIACPVLTVVAERDLICPPEASLALSEAVASARTEVLRIGGSHIGAVVGPRAARSLYPALGEWFRSTLCN